MSTQYDASEQWQFAASCNPNQRENDAFKMPRYWSDELGLPNVGPIWGDYPITKDEFLRRQRRYGCAACAEGTCTQPAGHTAG